MPSPSLPSPAPRGRRTRTTRRPSREELTRLLDRWNDGAPEDRLGKAIELCTKRVKAKTDDTTAHLELARLKLAKGEAEGAGTEARIAESFLGEAVRLAIGETADTPDKKAMRDRKALALKEQLAHANALHLLAYSVYGNEKAAKENDEEKRSKLLSEFKQTLRELRDKLDASAGSKEALARVLKEEQDRVGFAAFMNELGRPAKELPNKKDQADVEWRFDAYLGKVVVVVFWGAWDPEAKAKLEEIKKVQEQFKDRGLEVLGISLDRDRAALEGVLKDTKISWRHYFDGKGEANDFATAWKVHGFVAYLLDHTGRVRYVNVRGEGLDAAVKQLVERAEKSGKKKKGE
ncbi:TlpA family protein disulfide reductase [bacterium]|nr:TlpA family protein disulfide reductase [bacterium]